MNLNEDPAPAGGTGSENISMSFLSGEGAGSLKPNLGGTGHAADAGNGYPGHDHINLAIDSNLRVKHPDHSEPMNEFKFDQAFMA